MPGPFDGIRVVDFGRYIAGPFCAALLGDLGAEVIRVEKRDGREDRTLVSLAENEDGSPREGAMFLQMNRNKKSLTLDPMSDAGREIVKRLVKSADVVVANLPAETLKAMGLDWESVSAINPRAVLAVVSAFGLEGPYATRVGFDGVAQAMSGAVWFAGTPEQPVRAAAISGSISERRRCWRSASRLRCARERPPGADNSWKARCCGPRSPSSVRP